MATSLTQSGQFALSLQVQNIFSGDTLGLRQAQIALSRAFSPTDTPPSIIDIGGFVAAEEVTCATGEWHMADPADPFQGMGNAIVNDGFDPVGKDLIALIVVSDDDNEDAITIKQAAANGCPILTPASAAYTLQPGGAFLFLDPSGTNVANLVRGTNDIIGIVATGSPTVRVLAVYSS